MEGAVLVEAVAITRFPVDGEDATGFLGAWISGLRMHPTLDAVVLGGITIAGLGIVDIAELAAQLETPVLVVTRRDPTDHRLAEALRAAQLSERLEIVNRTPPAVRAKDGLYVAHAGIGTPSALELLDACSAKSNFPEPLRVAHLLAAALVRGESRGRV